MNIVCLDLEGVLVPEIWITFSQTTGIPELSRTTRDEPDYDKLMSFRLDILKKNNLKLPDIQNVISRMEPLDGAVEFYNTAREKYQLIILSDTFTEFARPLMRKLSWPTLFCNSLQTDKDGNVTGYVMRQRNGKREAVKALKSINARVFSAGDSYNDIDMILASDSGCLFRAPERIKKEYSDIKSVETFDSLFDEINKFFD